MRKTVLILALALAACGPPQPPAGVFPIEPRPAGVPIPFVHQIYPWCLHQNGTGEFYFVIPYDGEWGTIVYPPGSAPQVNPPSFRRANTEMRQISVTPWYVVVRQGGKNYHASNKVEFLPERWCQ